MKQESKRGGKREGAGRKPTGRIKKPITAYIEENVILEKGGIDAIRAIMVNAVYDNRNNPLINAARGRDESGSNEDESNVADILNNFKGNVANPANTKNMEEDGNSEVLDRISAIEGKLALPSKYLPQSKRTPLEKELRELQSKLK